MQRRAGPGIHFRCFRQRRGTAGAGGAYAVGPSHAARLMAYQAAWKADRGEDFHVEASAVKLFADEMLMRVADRAIQIHGGIGLSRELPLEAIFRDARTRLITEGSSEMQRVIISAEMLSSRRDASLFR